MTNPDKAYPLSRRGQRKCIFCGGSPLTREHVLPKWTHKHLILNRRPRATGVSVRDLVTRTDDFQPAKRPGTIQTAQVAVVCGSKSWALDRDPCNSGWMSRLEEQVQPILIPMFEGRKIVLTPQDQRTLARWCVVRAMVTQYADYPRQPEWRIPTPQSERDHVRLNDHPPPNWRVWVCRLRNSFQTCRGTYGTKAFSATREGIAEISRVETGEAIPNTHIWTRVIGRVMFIAIGSVHAGYVARWKFPDFLANRMLEVWPAKEYPVQWPPHYFSLSTKEYHYIHVGLLRYFLAFKDQVPGYLRTNQEHSWAHTFGFKANPL